MTSSGQRGLRWCLLCLAASVLWLAALPAAGQSQIARPQTAQPQTAQPEAAHQQTADPVVVMQAAIEDVLVQIKNHESLFRSNPEQLRAIVAEAALPHLAIQRMAQLALAKHWRTASAQQRDIYLREFRRYLIRSYTKTLYSYRHAKPKILGVNNSANNEDARKTTLKVSVNNELGEVVMLFLRLELQDAAWKVVDINVDGVSLVVTARGAFDEEINRTSLDSFLNNLTEQNNKAATANHE